MARLLGLPCLAGDREYIRDLKEKHCHVLLEYNTEKSKATASSHQKTFQLPDGKEVNLGQEAFMCAEGLFNTSLLGESRIRVQCSNGCPA